MMADFMFQNMAYRATVYRTGENIHSIMLDSGLMLFQSIGSKKKCPSKLRAFFILESTAIVNERNVNWFYILVLYVL